MRVKTLLLALTMTASAAACATTTGQRTPMQSAGMESAPADGLSVTGQKSPDDETAYVCPMHPDFTSEKPGTCPRCGMDLVLGTPFDMRDYRLDFDTVPRVVKAGEKIQLHLKAVHPGTNEVITKFETVHDRLFHLFVISQDMEHFEHIHPEQMADGTWTIETVLPKPGYYKVLSDFMPSGGAAQFLSRPLVTENYEGDMIASSARLEPESGPRLKKTVGDLTTQVEFEPKTFAAGIYGHIAFHLVDTATARPVTDLQTYLGAFGHTLIMSEDMTSYVHAHPIEPMLPNVKVDEIRGGPTVTFEGLMPKPGRYRAWTQFRRDDKLHTFVTTFNVIDVGELSQAQ
jgi:hypothetical protein